MASMGRSFLPNLLTLANLGFGSWAIALSYEQRWDLFAGALAAAMVCDWLDGFAARLLRAESPLGKELDALADLVSFGIAPSFALYNYLRTELPTLPYSRGARFWMVIVPFLLPLLAAWRLARFNATPPEGRKEFFTGLPTPAHGAFWAGWLLTAPGGIWLHPAAWIAQVTLLGIAMVSKWPFLALKSRKRWPYWVGFTVAGGGWLGLCGQSTHLAAAPLGLLLLYATISKLASLRPSAPD